MSAEVWVRIELERREGAFERLVALLYRKRIRFNEFHAAAKSSLWEIELELQVDDIAVHHALGAIDREPALLSVGPMPRRPSRA